ncbi:hypothetical protein LTS09_011441 [Friedmanniomyces endolithicus]|nr:hypothetical protein LTS09_011441 [Friedmanniomyces endolithicus]
MAPPRSFAQKAAQELGLTTLVHSPRDIPLLLLTRLIRMFAYGSSTLILALFFAALNHSDAQIGLFMSLTLVGDVLISLLLTLVADSLGRRRILIMGALLMTFSGAVFATVGNYWILLLAAVLGVISPSGNEIGPFRAVEESTIAHLSDASTRSDVFAWYVVFGTLGTAGGALACGWVTQGLQAAGWSELASFRPACEAQQAATKKPEEEAEGVDLQEQQPFLADGTAAPPPKPKPVPKRIGITTLSAKSRATLIRLCALFFFDSLASGMVPNSLIAFFMERKFNMPQGKLGTILATASFMSSIGNIMASSIAKRIGLVKTMVFTHLPSAIFLALFPLPTSLVITIILLVARASLSSMDQAPRSAFLSAVVLPEERTAVMGIVNTVKTMSQSSGPLITGTLAGGGRFWVAFVVAGALKASYDVGMLTMFVGMKIEGDRKPEPADEEAEPESDDDSLTGDAPANRSRS